MLALKSFTKHTAAGRMLGLVFAGMLALGLTACGGQTANLEEAAKAAVQLDSAQMPADIKLVSSAMLMQAKGFGADRVEGVTFAPGAADNLKAIGMDYDGFVLAGVNILNYEPSAQTTELAALLLLEDSVGRRTGMRFLAQYAVVGDGVSIQHASQVQVHAMWPRIETYVVPFNPNVDQGAIMADHKTLYMYAVNNAVTIDKAAAGVGDYDVFMFNMDRSSSTSDTTGWISKSDSPKSGYADATTVLDFNGWKVAVVSGEFNPRSMEETLYVKYLHTPGEEAAWYSRTKLLSGLFALTAKAQNAN